MKIIQQNQPLCEEIIPTDCVNRLFLYLILFQIFLFHLYIRKFVNSLLNYQQQISLQNFKPIFPLILRLFDLECHGQTSLIVAFVKFAQVFMKFRKLESLQTKHQVQLKKKMEKHKKKHQIKQKKKKKQSKKKLKFSLLDIFHGKFDTKTSPIF